MWKILIIFGTFVALAQPELLFYNQIYNAITAKQVNVVYSPFNTHTALSLVYQGAAGDMIEHFRRHLKVQNQVVTANQYKSILNEMGHTTSNVSVTMANKIYVKDNYHLKESFKKVATDFFNADVQTVDFRKRKHVANDMTNWVKRRTKHKKARSISIGDFADNSCAVVLNAMSFKGAWAIPFFPKETYSEKFYFAGSKTVSCNMMKRIDYFEYAEVKELQAKIVRMFYADRKYSKIIVLPNDRFGLATLEKKIVQKDINIVVQQSKLVKKPLQLCLPKYKIEDAVELKEPLSKCGFGNMFTSSNKFSNMVAANESMKFDRLLQSTFLECSEHGSFTGVKSGFQKTSARISGPVNLFKVDHPFLFYVTASLATVHPVNNVLFMGKVENPNVLIS